MELRDILLHVLNTSPFPETRLDESDLCVERVLLYHKEWTFLRQEPGEHSGVLSDVR
jgi:hypothetical protein